MRLLVENFEVFETVVFFETFKAFAGLARNCMVPSGGGIALALLMLFVMVLGIKKNLLVVEGQFCYW